MGTLTLFVVMASTPVWYQGEGVACGEALKAHAPIYALETFGGMGQDDVGKSIIVVDERDTRLRRLKCKKIRIKLKGEGYVEVFRAAK